MKKYLLFITLISLVNFANAQYSYDTVSFEKPTSKIVISNTSNNLWQIGSPQKILFDSAYSGKNAIMTDTILDYPPNDTSSFIYIIRNPYTQTCETCMEFWHKYDMDSLGDKGIIRASYDGGNSWLLLKDTFNVTPWGSFFNWQYDFHSSNGSYTAHKLITSGRSDGWIKSSICWQWFIPVKKDTIISMPDSLMIRFTFISDSTIKNKEGWMIDNIVTSSAAPQNCSGIEENSIRENVFVYPNPATEKLTIESFQKSTIDIFNIQGQIILRQQLQQDKTDIDISGLAKGVYILRLYGNDKTAVSRILKE